MKEDRFLARVRPHWSIAKCRSVCLSLRQSDYLSRSWPWMTLNSVMTV